MATLSLVLSPIVALMRWLYEGYEAIIGSAGLSILVLSFTFSLLLLPLQRLAMRLERRVAARARSAGREIAEARARGLKGEALFEATEAAYKKHGYHPIQAGLGAASILVMLPVLISSIILFRNPEVTGGQAFAFVSDLSVPDGALRIFGLTVNVLPLMMFGITFLDMSLRYAGDRGAQTRFLVVSVVLLVLVYSMPAGLVLYWVGNNLFAMVVALLLRRAAIEASAEG